MDLNQFIQQHRDQYVDDDGTLGPNTPGGQAQCVNLANAWCAALGIEQFPGNAGEFNFDSHPDCVWVPNQPDNFPGPGDIVVWDVQPMLPYGHVAVAEPGCTATVLIAFTQNWPFGSPCHSQGYAYTSPQVAGWLHPRVLDAPAPAPEPPSDVRWGRFSGVVDVDIANVRSGAGTRFGVLYQLHRGNQLGFDGYVHTGQGIPDAATGQPDDRWFHIISDGREGWIASALVDGNPDF